jgi:hypothetical protein
MFIMKLTPRLSVFITPGQAAFGYIAILTAIAVGGCIALVAIGS